jgi:DNA-binding GntR family transcriptional regulator
MRFPSERWAKSGVVSRTKTEATVSMVKDAIYSGRYEAGSKLSQTEVAKELGLSPTPVREAFRILLAQGLLRQRAHHSVEVTKPDLAELRDLYHVRALLEADAVQLAAQQLTAGALARLAEACRAMERGLAEGRRAEIRAADEFFHGFLYEQCNNPTLVDLISQLWGRFPRHMLWVAPGRLAQSVQEHAELLQALQARRGDQAAEVIRRHLQNALASLELTLAEPRSC